MSSILNQAAQKQSMYRIKYIVSKEAPHLREKLPPKAAHIRNLAEVSRLVRQAFAALRNIAALGG